MAINKHEVMNLVLGKGVDWFYEFIEDLTPDDAVEVIYEDNYRWQDRDNALVVNVKWRGSPDLEEVAEILSRRLNVDKEEIMRIFERNASDVDELFWFEVGRAIEDLSNELGVEIYQYGRSAGYWGIPVEEIKYRLDVPESVVKRILRDFLRSEKFERIYKFIKENFKSIEYPSVEGYLSDAFRVFVDDLKHEGKLNVYDFVVFKDNLPERFFRAVERTVREHEDQNFWADIYEDFVRDKLMERKEQI